MVEWAVKFSNGKSLCVSIYDYELTLVATIYALRGERNARIFQKKGIGPAWTQDFNTGWVDMKKNVMYRRQYPFLSIQITPPKRLSQIFSIIFHNYTVRPHKIIATCNLVHLHPYQKAE